MPVVVEHLIRAVGWDGGNSMTNVVAEAGRGQSWVDMPTEVVSVRGWRPASDHKLENALYARITSPALKESDYWLVGSGVANETDLADKVQRTAKGANKAESDPIYVTGLMALAWLGIRRFGPDIRGGKLAVRIKALAGSLPWSQFGDEQNKKRREASLKATHRLEFPELPGIGALDMALTIENVMESPEGMPALMSLAYRVNGEDALTAARPELVKSIVGVADVGGGTTDLLMFEPKLRLMRGSCDTLQYGVNDALRKAHKRLVNDGWGLKFGTVASIVEHIRRGEWEVAGKGGKTLNLHNYLDDDLTTIAKAVSSEINARWTEAVPHFFLVGGGAHVLKPFLQLNDAPEVPNNPEWANAVGNYIIARLALGERAR